MITFASATTLNFGEEVETHQSHQQQYLQHCMVSSTMDRRNIAMGFDSVFAYASPMKAILEALQTIPERANVYVLMLRWQYHLRN